jgi:hypothetical protein
MPDHPDLMTEYAELIGQVVIAWNEVQWLVSVLFVEFSGMPAERARDVFFTLKSDFAQRDIALAAGKTALAKFPTLWEQLQNVIKAINDLAGERNAAVHTMWGIEWVSWGGVSYSAKVGLLSGVTPHKRLKDDFVTQCAELRQKLQNHFVELDHVRSEYEKWTE